MVNLYLNTSNAEIRFNKFVSIFECFSKYSAKFIFIFNSNPNIFANLETKCLKL